MDQSQKEKKWRRLWSAQWAARLFIFFFRSKRSVFVFCCNRLALVWFHHYFISHFSFFPSAFSFKLVDVTLSCRENRSKTVSLKFSVTPKRSHITEMASQAKVSPAHRLSETPHVQVQTLICCSSPLHSSSIQTTLWGRRGDAVGGRQKVHGQVRRPRRKARERSHILQRWVNF